MEAAIARLPAGYADALDAALGGASGDDLAMRLGIPLDSVGPLLRLATAKLVNLLHDGH